MTELWEQVGAAGSWDERFRAVDEILLRRAEPDCTVRDELGYAWGRLVGTGGAIGVQELAGEVGWSPRHLGGRFRAEFGLGPKAAGRVARFDQVRRRLQAQGAGAGTLATLAADHGYYDQAHLAREFRSLAGCPPSVWLADEFRNVQATGWDGAPDSTA